jgi:hypothetical protein
VARALTGFLVAIGLACASQAPAGQVMISDTEPMIDFPACDCKENLPDALPFALFDFAGQPSLNRLTGLEITLTLEDGDTGAGDFDADALSLGLDDVSTGLLLNGFRDGSELTLTFGSERGDPNWIGDETAAALLETLRADDRLIAKILDATPFDNAANTYSAFDTTLKLTGEMLTASTDPVPEPIAACVWLTALVPLLARRVFARRRR